MACSNCKPHIQQLLKTNSELKAQVAKLQVANEELQKKCDIMEKQNDLWEQVDSDFIHPNMLPLHNYQNYLLGIIQRFPIIGMILNLFMSDSHIRKTKAKKTNSKWLIWSYFYQSWLADLFLRSRSPKSVRCTTLLVSAYLLFGNVSNSCWRLLQRLKVVVSKEVVEKWITSFKKELRSNKSLLFSVLDNCDMKLHVTRVRTHNRTQMKHLISRYITFISISLFFSFY